MALSIATQVRPPQVTGGLGNVNPMEMMNQMMQLRNTQQQWNADTEAGEIWATSKDPAEAAERMRQSPNAAWMGHQMTQARQQQLMQADIARTQAETTRAGVETQVAQSRLGQIGTEVTQRQFETDTARLNRAIQTSGNDPTAFDAAIDSAKAHANPANAYLFDDVKKSVTGNLSTDPGKAWQQFEMNRAGALVASGLHSDESFQIQGTTPPAYRTDIPDTTGLGRTGIAVTGGPGSFPPPAGGYPAPQAGPAPPANQLAPAPAQADPGLLPRGVQYGAPEGAPEQTKAITEENVQVAQRAPSEMMRLNMMDQALHEFQAGGWAKDRMYLASDAQGLKNALDQAGIHIIPDSAIKAIGNKSLSSSQLFEALIRPFVTAQLRDAVAGTGAGRIRDEVQAFLTSADASKDPATLMKLINQVKFGMAVGIDRANSWPEYQRLLVNRDPSVAGLYPGDFYGWYNKSPKLAAINKEYGGNMDLSPYSTKGVKGITEPPKELRVQGGRVYEKQEDGSFKYVHPDYSTGR